MIDVVMPVLDEVGAVVTLIDRASPKNGAVVQR